MVLAAAAADEYFCTKDEFMSETNVTKWRESGTHENAWNEKMSTNTHSHSDYARGLPKIEFASVQFTANCTIIKACFHDRIHRER